jgi:hypothetical protein
MEKRMTKFLVHNGGSRQYRSIIRYLQKLIPNTHYAVNHLHNKIFDFAYVVKPDILIFPISEYTQEIHNYIEKNANTIKTVLFIDIQVPQVELLNHLSKNNCRFILDSKIGYSLSNSISYDHIYDDQIFTRIEVGERNNKLAVSLSLDNGKNTKLLKDILYPNITKYPLVLFNNPEFKHEQNIGVYNESDLNYILNKFSYFMDLDGEFLIEAKVCGIPVLNECSNTDEAIDNKNYNTIFDNTQIEQYKCSSFVENHLAPFLGIR